MRSNTNAPIFVGVSLVDQMVKNLPAVWETWVQNLDSKPGFGKSPGERNEEYPL